jgi:hypothetical protein
VHLSAAGCTRHRIHRTASHTVFPLLKATRSTALAAVACCIQPRCPSQRKNPLAREQLLASAETNPGCSALPKSMCCLTCFGSMNPFLGCMSISSIYTQTQTRHVPTHTAASRLVHTLQLFSYCQTTGSKVRGQTTHMCSSDPPMTDQVNSTFR